MSLVNGLALFISNRTLLRRRVDDLKTSNEVSYSPCEIQSKGFYSIKKIYKNNNLYCFCICIKYFFKFVCLAGLWFGISNTFNYTFGKFMKKKWVSCFFISVLSLQAFGNIDHRLEIYIKNFKLKSVESPGPRNDRLFTLGGRLFFDRNLSGNKNISCADCHHPRLFSTDGLPLALGEGAVGIESIPGGRTQASGKIIPRNSPALFNLHRAPNLFWDGRVSWNKQSGEVVSPVKLSSKYLSVLTNILGVQALFPMVSHEEMRGEIGTNEIANASTEEDAWELIFKRIIDVDYYRNDLQEIFPGEDLTIAHLAEAISHFESHAFYSTDTNYDRYLNGDLSAMNDKEKRGMEVFFSKGECFKCHKGELLSDSSFHNIGVPQIGPGKNNGDDFGLFGITKNENHLYAFRVPPLRNVALTAPYFHDGAMKTIEEVVEHYDDVISSLNSYEWMDHWPNYSEAITGPLRESNQRKIENLSFKLSPSLKFSEDEEEDLVYFLKESLTDRKYKKSF